MTWTKLPPLSGKQQPCLHAGVADDVFPMDGIIAVGFGAAQVTCDGKLILDGESSELEDYVTGADAEAAALRDPDHDWRISLYGPLSERVYQRHGDGLWVLVEQGDGFA